MTIVGLLSTPSIAFMTTIGIATAFTWQAFTSFFPTFLIEFHGMTAGSAGTVFGSIFLLSAFGQPVMGKLSEHFSRDAVLSVIFLAVASGLGLLLVGRSLPTLVCSVGLIGLGLSWGGVFQSRFMDSLSDEQRGTGFGLVRTIYLFLGSTGSVTTGFLVDTTGWTVAYGLVVFLLLLAVLSLTANRLLGLRL